jgi:hypothetical protein
VRVCSSERIRGKLLRAPGKRGKFISSGKRGPPKKPGRPTTFSGRQNMPIKPSPTRTTHTKSAGGSRLSYRPVTPGSIMESRPGPQDPGGVSPKVGKFSEQIWENQASVNNAGPLPAHAITELQRPDRSTTEGSLPDRPRAAARGRPAWPGAPWPGIPSVPGLSDDLTRSCRGERGICRPEHEEPLLPQRVQLAPYILAEAALHRACERPDG